MVAVTLGLALWLFMAQQRSALEQAHATRVMDLAEVVAAKASVGDALRQPGRLDATLQEEIDGLRRSLGVDFIVVMDRQSRRLTHPEPARIDEPFQGDDEGPALAGERYASRAEGTLGTSIRGFAPVRGADQEVVGAVAVGVTLAALLPTLEEHRRRILMSVLALVVAAGVAAGGLARYLKRTLLGLEPHQIARLVEERQALLSSVHEGILAVDQHARITLANAAAQRLLERAGLPAPQPGTALDDYLPSGALLEVLATGQPALDQEVTLHGQPLIVNRLPVYHRQRLIGAVATFRDKGEVDRLAEQLTGVRRYAEALRASTHEVKNTLHVITGLTQLGDLEALRRYLRELASGPLVAPLPDERLRDPVLAGFLLGKRSEAQERGISLRVEAGSDIPVFADSALSHTLVTVIGNLLENAFEALVDAERRDVSLLLAVDEEVLTIEVQDSGPGIAPALLSRVCIRGVSTKGEARGLGLALAKARLEAHGGTLSLYSHPGQGTLAEASLPLQEIPA
ncbi:Spo0B domain-containing protein [Halomonas sp. ML-15]|nr:Spo0B domain-containing protein [Halomonas sp. ML-15]